MQHLRASTQAIQQLHRARTMHPACLLGIYLNVRQDAVASFPFRMCHSRGLCNPAAQQKVFAATSDAPRSLVISKLSQRALGETEQILPRPRLRVESLPYMQQRLSLSLQRGLPERQRGSILIT